MALEKVQWDKLVRVGFHDPAGRKPKSGTIKYSAARAAWVMVGSDALGRVFVLDAHAGKMSPTEMQDKCFEFCDKWDPIVFGVEANAMQSLYADLTMHRAREEKRRIPLQAVTQPTNIDKDFRIRQALRPVASRGQLFIPPKFVELRQEIQGFPSNPRKDLIDALASAVMLLPPPIPTHTRNEELESRLEYLRETGAPPAYIDRVARGLEP